MTLTSKPRYNWWPFALNMIRDYPERLQDYKDLHEQKITAASSGMPGAAGTSRSVEQAALRTLPPQEQREYEAVRRAIERTRRMPNARERLELVRLTLWRYHYTLHDAADLLHISEQTARRFRHQFVLLVGSCYGFLSEAEYLEAAKRTRESENGTPKAK